jgi:hypothetical protein
MAVGFWGWGPRFGRSLDDWVNGKRRPGLRRFQQVSGTLLCAIFSIILIANGIARL